MSEDDKEATAKALADVRAMLGILGLDPLDPSWQSGATGAGRGGELREAVDSLVRLVLGQRQAARERKDYATADAIRDELKQAGLVIEDTPSGPRWELGGDGH